MLKFFQLCSIVTVLGFGSLFANSHPAPGHLEVSADFIYLKPSVDDSYFVIKSPTGVSLPFFLAGERINNDFDFEPGFRVGGAYALCDCNREFQIYYTRLDSNQHKLVSGEFLYATTGCAACAEQFFNYTGTASSKLDCLYQRVDANYAQQVFNCCGLDLYVQLGLEYADIHFTETFQYIRTVPETGLPTEGTVHHNLKTWGVGPQLGFALDYDLYQCATSYLPGTLSLNIVSSGSLLVGETKFHLTDRNLDINNKDTWRVVPALHAKIGLNYETCISCYSTSLEIGYEFNSYFRSLTRVAAPDPNSVVSYNNFNNFDTQGLYVSAIMRF